MYSVSGACIRDGLRVGAEARLLFVSFAHVNRFTSLFVAAFVLYSSIPTQS